MPVDPHVQGFLDLLERLDRAPISSQTPDEARDAFRKLALGARHPDHVVPVGTVEEVEVAGADGPLPARLYRPEAPDGAGAGAPPLVVFFHGGGFVIGDLDTHDDAARTICRGTSSVVVSVDYRRAPEHPFPAPAEDAIAAVADVAARTGELGGDPARVAVAGDSAGANLAAVSAIAARDRGIALAAQLLIYPVVDYVGDHPSRTENAEGYFLTADEIAWFDRQYVPEGADRGDWRLSPLHAPDLSGLPPAVVVTAHYDPLRDEGEAYAEALRAAGVEVDLRRYPDLIHGFLDMARISPVAEAAVADVVGLFAARLADAVTPPRR